MKIFLGTDHNGYEFKKDILKYLTTIDVEAIDVNQVLDPNDDFPQFAGRVCTEVLAHYSDDVRGILICGSGQGMVMAANRFKKIRASLCFNPAEARSARNDDNSNILCLSSTFSTVEEAKQIINTWLITPFAKAPRFIRRLDQLDLLG